MLFGPTLFILLSWKSASLKLLGVKSISLSLSLAACYSRDVFVCTHRHARAQPDLSRGRLNSKSRPGSELLLRLFTCAPHQLRSHDPLRSQDSSLADVLITAGGSNFSLARFMGLHRPAPTGVKLLCVRRPRALAKRNRCGPARLTISFAARPVCGQAVKGAACVPEEAGKKFRRDQKK